jgi:DNA-binding CsgD family transcriptional regulator
MKIDKQNKLIAILETGRYKVEGNEVLTLKSNGWRPLLGNTLPSGYKQFILFNGKRGPEGIKVIVYQHVLTYIATHGPYTEGLVVDHIDGNVSNNRIDNLRAIPQRANIRPDKTYATRSANEYGTTPIRAKEIEDIKELMALGFSQAHIARTLNLNRCSVRYTINNIKSGKVLKFEGPM